MELSDERSMLNPLAVLEIPLEAIREDAAHVTPLQPENQTTPIREMIMPDLQTPSDLPKTPMPTTPQLYDKRPVPMPRREVARGSLPKKSRKQLREPINFASRKPTTNREQPHTSR